MRTTSTRGSSTVAVTMTALSLIDSDAPIPWSDATSVALNAATPAPLLSMRRYHLWTALDAFYHTI